MASMAAKTRTPPKDWALPGRQSLQQPPKRILHELLALVTLNPFPVGHVQRHHAVAHHDDPPTVCHLHGCAEGIGIRSVIEAKRSPTGDRPRAVIRDFQALLGNEACFRVAACQRIGTLTTELYAERTESSGLRMSVTERLAGRGSTAVGWFDQRRQLLRRPTSPRASAQQF
jgi:hypothetical protein